MILRWYLSGGQDNRNPDRALGGPRSSVEVGSLLNNLFPDVSSQEASQGSTRHRCVYLVNEDPNPAGLLPPIRAWLLGLPQTPGQELTIAVARVKGEVSELDDDEEAPAGLTFGAPLGKDSGHDCPGPLLRGDLLAVWARRTVRAGAGTNIVVRCRIVVEGDIIPVTKEG